MGFEALSRGAEKIFLNDSMRGAFLTLKQNEEAISKAFQHPKEAMVITNLDAKTWVSKELKFQLPETEDAILFLDPPYGDHKLYFEVLNLLKEAGFKGEIWLESDRLMGPPSKDLTGAFHSVIKTVEQGDHFVVIGKLI